MSLLQKIKADQVKARKEFSTKTASLLTTLIGEAEMVGKNAGNRESTNEEVRKVIRKFIKNNTDTIKILEKDSMDTGKDNVSSIYNLVSENDILSSYLPRMLSNDDLSFEIWNIIQEKKTVAKNIIMKELSARSQEKFEYDAKTASSFIDKAINDLKGALP